MTERSSAPICKYCDAPLLEDESCSNNECRKAATDPAPPIARARASSRSMKAVRPVKDPDCQHASLKPTDRFCQDCGEPAAHRTSGVRPKHGTNAGSDGNSNSAAG